MKLYRRAGYTSIDLLSHEGMLEELGVKTKFKNKNLIRFIMYQEC